MRRPRCSIHRRSKGSANLLLFAQSKVEGYFSRQAPFAVLRVERRIRRLSRNTHCRRGHRARGLAGVRAHAASLFLRKFEEENDMAVYLLVDTSASMQYRGTGVEPKFAQAAKIAAALAYLMIHQGDKAVAGRSSRRNWSPNTSRPAAPGGTCINLVRELERRAAPRRGPASEHALAASASSVFRKRGRIVILSDFLGDRGEAFRRARAIRPPQVRDTASPGARPR